MDIELVTVGTELLLGYTVDTNGAEIGRALAAEGIRLVRRTAVADRPEEIAAAVAGALSRSGAVLTTGGLGPTRDDMTKTVVAALYDAPLEFDEDVWAALLERYRRFGRAPAASNRTQAEVPRGATVLPNRWGTAPGLWLEGEPGLTIMLPGVPGEMRNLLAHEVVPRLRGRGAGKVIRSRVVRTSGIAESTLAEQLGEIEAEIEPLSLAYLPGVAGVDLRLTAWGLDPDAADSALEAAVERLVDLAGGFAYGTDDADLAAVVLDRARRRGLRVAAAESCTGGMVGARLTAVPGSSDVFVGGVVCYDNRLKSELLGVDPALIAAHGAVSAEVAAAMASGARERLGVDLAVSVTGIAGPGGGTDDKPIGTVWLGIAGPEAVETARSVFGGGREEIRARAAQGALRLLLGGLDGVSA
jgi:nicotinamide-nucleotide amidase